MPTPGFIRELRRHIGNETLWLSGANLVVLREGEDVMDEVTFPNGDRCRFLDHGFRGRLVGGRPGIGDGEISDFGWFPANRLPVPRQERLEEQVRICLEDPRDVVLGLERR